MTHQVVPKLFIQGQCKIHSGPESRNWEQPELVTLYLVGENSILSEIRGKSIKGAFQLGLFRFQVVRGDPKGNGGAGMPGTERQIRGALLYGDRKEPNATFPQMTINYL